MTFRSLVVFVCVVLASHAAAVFAQPLTTSFTYQGELQTSGQPASGSFDLRFRLYDAAGSGSQIGSDICRNDLFITNGRFVVNLDFGDVFTGQKRFLEIDVRPDAGADCTITTGFETLAPRQELTASPNATFALNASSTATAGNALTLNGQNPAFYQNAANLTGTLSDERLSGNVARLNSDQTFTGQLTLSNSLNIFNGAFSGNGAGLLNLDGANVQPGTLTRSRVAPDIESVLSQWTSLPSVPPTQDASAWGSNFFGQTNLPALPIGQSYTKISAGRTHTLALRSDGTIVGCGSNDDGELNAPALPSGVVYTAVAAGDTFSLALRSDGTIATFGANVSGQLNVPALPPGVTYTAVSAGQQHSLALRSDGIVVGFGSNLDDRITVPALPPGVTYTAISAGFNHSLALRSDGVIVGFGSNTDGQTTAPALPPTVSYTAISAGGNHSLALRSDGTVAAFGSNAQGQLDIPLFNPPLTYTAISAGGNHSLALRTDGVIISYGFNGNGQLNVPLLPSDQVYVAISAGFNHSTALRFRATTVPPALQSLSTVAIGSAPRPSTGGLSVQSSIRVDGAGANAGTLDHALLFGNEVARVGIASNQAQGTNLEGLDLITAGVPRLRVYASGFVEVPSTFTAVTVSANTLLGSGSSITNLNASNIASGTIANARTTARTTNDPNSLVLRDPSGNFAAGTVTASSFAGSGASLTGLNASNLSTGTIPNARTTGVATNTPSSLVLRDASGNFAANAVTASSFAGSGASLTGLDASNISAGTLPNARTTARTTNDPNTLVLRDASGNFAAGTITASSFAGSGASLTGLNASNLSTGTIPNARTTGVATNTPNTLVLRDASGNFAAGTITASSFAGSGASLTGLNASNLSTGTLPAARLPAIAARTDAANAFGNFTNSFAGNVGIATTTPAAPLDVAGNLRILSNGTIRSSGFQGAGGTFNGMIESHYADNDRYGMTQLTNGILALYTSSSFGPASIQFGNMTGASSFDSKMTLTRTGRLGIGTTSPQAALDVESSVFAGSGTFNGTIFGTTVDSTTNKIWYAGSRTGGGALMGVLSFSQVMTGGVSIDFNQFTTTSFADVKNFVEPNPRDQATDIYYASLEGPEAAMYVRGTAQLVDGRAIVTLPQHFTDLASARGLTVQVTPQSEDSMGLAVVRKGTDSFEVRELMRGQGTYEFDWHVTAVRARFQNMEIIRPWTERLPDGAKPDELWPKRQELHEKAMKQTREAEQRGASDEPSAQAQPSAAVVGSSSTTQR